MTHATYAPHVDALAHLDSSSDHELFAELEQIVKPEGILATNTSTLPVVEMAVATQRPDRVCGIHFFNPAPVMKLVEVVRPLTASDDTIKSALAFATACGKEKSGERRNPGGDGGQCVEGCRQAG